jgi:hypothetical protein
MSSVENWQKHNAFIITKNNEKYWFEITPHDKFEKIKPIVLESLCNLIDTYPADPLKNDILRDYSEKINDWLLKNKSNN